GCWRTATARPSGPRSPSAELRRPAWNAPGDIPREVRNGLLLVLLLDALEDEELDAAVLRPAVLVVLLADGLGGAEAAGLQPLGVDALAVGVLVVDEVLLHRLGAVLGELHVVL